MAWSDNVNKEFERLTLGEQTAHLFQLIDVMAEEITRLVGLVNENFQTISTNFQNMDESIDRLNTSIHMALCNCQECSLGKEIYNLMEVDRPAVTNLDD
tara:strand:- start:130 stop:426 length:297 start_codon:yes stop_codon:yes gene_type:complete